MSSHHLSPDNREKEQMTNDWLVVCVVCVYAEVVEVVVIVVVEEFLTKHVWEKDVWRKGTKAVRRGEWDARQTRSGVSKYIADLQALALA